MLKYSTALLLLGCAIASAQAPADPVIRVSVDLVQVDAVVTDLKGNHITDLRPEDFEIFEDGKPQKITNFSWISAMPPKPTPGTSSGPAKTPQREDIHRSIVLMIDDLGTSWRDVIGVIATAKRFVQNRVGPGDLVAITASRGGMGFYQQFTNDKQQLLGAIDRLLNRPGFGQWAFETSAGPPNPVGYLTWAIQGLREVPGRKAVVLFTAGMAAPASLINLANRSGVVVYTINPVGFGGQAAPDAPERLLAEKTGGLWIRSLAGGHELDEDLDKVLEDISGYYLIGYRPGRSDFELSQGRPVHHDIQVRVTRTGLTVRSGNGFMGVSDAAVPQPKTREEFLEEALFSPFRASGVRLRLDPVYGASSPDPKTKRRKPVLRAMLTIDGRDIHFTDGPDGKRKMPLDLIVSVFNQEGARVASANQRFTISATPAQAGELAVTGIHLAKEVKLPKAGPYQVRAAVREPDSGATGSAYSFVELPNFDGSKIALSSLVLSGGKDSMGWGEFTPGTTVRFGCELFGVHGGGPPAQPKVEMEVRLYRENAPVFDSKPIAVAPSNIAQHLLTGSMKIGEEMEAGDYAMQVVASSGKHKATQWIDLTVVKP